MSAFLAMTKKPFVHRFRISGEVVGQTGVLRAIDRYAAKMAEQNAQRPEKPFLFHQEVDFPSLGSGIQLTEQEIPVACVWSQANDVFVGMGCGHVFPPPHVFVQ